MTSWIPVSDECINPSPGDLFARIQRQQTEAFIKQQRAELSTICGDYTAWMCYPPMASDDPADYAPYWVRWIDLVDDVR